MTPEQCADQGHPLVTYNASLHNTWCSCGSVRVAGEQPVDWDVKWSAFHDHSRDEPCHCYVRRQSASRARALADPGPTPRPDTDTKEQT